MGTFIVVVMFVLVVAAGIFWGRNTIKREISRVEHDDQQLDKLHKMRE